jgi:hypothetical protein
MPFEIRLAVFFVLVLLLAGCSPAVYSTSTPAPGSIAGNNNGAGGIGGGDDGLTTGDGGGTTPQPNLEEGIDDPSLLDEHPCSSGSGKGVLVCHLPPGNPAEFHTICIPQQALKAHIDEPHGDQPDILGDCRDAF